MIRSAYDTPSITRDSDRQPRRVVLLLVSSDKQTVDQIRTALESDGDDVLVAADAPRAIARAQRDLPQLVILDLTCPDIEARQVARQLKADSRTAAMPIIMLTVRKDEADLTMGLALGADDYATKPVDVQKLRARIQAVLQRDQHTQAADRTRTEGAATLKAGPIELDTARHEVKVEGRVVDLTLPQFRLLVALVLASGEPMTREQLMAQSVGNDVFITDRAIDAEISTIRRKLGKAGRLIRARDGTYHIQTAVTAPK